MSTSVLILDCVHCADPDRANQDGRQCDGLREWTAEFDGPRIVDEAKSLCPECGKPGRVWSY